MNIDFDDQLKKISKKIFFGKKTETLYQINCGTKVRFVRKKYDRAKDLPKQTKILPVEHK